MDIGSLDLNLLRAFEALYETRSVSKAAERVGMRQPAMSAALARLRLAFSDPLFVKAAGAMQPTPRAIRLAASVTKVLAELRVAMQDAPFEPRQTLRTFTIASTDYTTLVVLPKVMTAVEREAPQIDLRIIGYDKDDIPDLLDRGDIDLALGVFRSPSTNSVRQFLCPERFVGLARRGHPLVKNGTMDLLDYAGASHALVSVRRDAAGEIDVALQARGLRRRIALTLPHMLVLPSILVASDLLVAIPSRVAALVAGDALQTFELPLTLASWRIEMLWNPASRRDSASCWLRTTVKAAARGRSD
jgi:DNA-binding transcriptional LysR family regulator